MALSGNQVTGFALYGGIARAYGDFSGKTPVVPVEVPDVVGETQVAGIATLEGDGFVVAVETAFSSVVPVGDIISQDPAGGEFALPGSTVTITVSLGDAPPAPSGGGGGAGGGGRIWYQGKRKKRTLLDLPNMHLDDILSRVEAEVLYRDVVAAAPAAQRKEADEIIAPFTIERETDWDALERDARKVGSLFRIWSELQIAKQRRRAADEWFMLMD